MKNFDNARNSHPHPISLQAYAPEKFPSRKKNFLGKGFLGVRTLILGHFEQRDIFIFTKIYILLHFEYIYTFIFLCLFPQDFIFGEMNVI